MENQKFMDLSVDLIDEPEREMRSVIVREKMDELVKSIRRLGIIQPLRVAEKGERYEVICGHRRLLAAKALGLVTVPAIVADSSDDVALAEAVHENFVREDVNPVDLAGWLQQVKQAKGLTNEALSSLFGKSRGWAGHYLALLHCDGGIQAAVAAGQIDVASAQRLQSVEDPNVRHSLLKHAVVGGASQSVISRWVAGAKGESVYSETGPEMEVDQENVPEPEPLVFECAFCRGEKPSEDQVAMPVCSECFQAFRAAAKIEQKKIEEVEKE